MIKYKTIFSLFISLFLLQGVYAIDTTNVKSKITDVTVFFSGAQITRNSEVKLAKGKYFLLIKNLPQELNPQSIQVKQFDFGKILSVKHSLNTENDSKKSVDELNLEKKIKDIEFKMKEINNKLSVYTLEEQLLNDNREIIKKSNGSTLAELKETADYFRIKLNEIKLAKLNLYKEFENYKESIQETNVKINELLSQRKKTYSHILIAIEVVKETAIKLNLSYFLPSAGWEPLYDFRVEDINKPLSITYNANVFHSSGENWDNVNITLSNNNPTLSGEKPELMAWYLDRNNPYEKPIVQKGAGTIKGKITDLENDEPLPFANILLMKGNEQISGTMSDMDGKYTFSQIPTGSYTIQTSYVGYTPKSITNILVNADKITFVDVKMEGSVSLNAFEIVSYEKPLVSKDQTSSGGTVTREDIAKMPGRSASSLASSVGGVNGDVFETFGYNQNIRGSRSYSNDTYVDGIKVRKNTETTDFITNTLKETATNIEYKIEIPYSIPSDGENYSIKIKEVTLPVEYLYNAIPKLEKDVFLSAIISDWTSLNLLSGKSSIYYQGTFTGESFIDVNSVKDSLTISLGRDNNIIVTREGNKLLNDKKIIGNNVKENIAWDIVIKNNKNTPINIVIEDQYPLSERKTIEVILLNSSNAKVDAKKGFLTWDIKVEPNTKTNIGFNYEVKYPKYSNIKID
jgi:hypothetical protein